MAYTRYQADLGSPFVPLPLHIVTGPKVVNYRQAFVNLGGQPWTQALGSVLVRVAFLQWGLEFRRRSFNHISRVLRGPVDIVYHAATRFSSMQIFGDGCLTLALLDRLTHKAHLLEFTGDSYRLRQQRLRQAKEA